MSEERLVIVGAGLMGRGIAQLGLLAGFHVDLVDPLEKARTAARDEIGNRLDRLVEKGSLDPAARQGMTGRLNTIAKFDTSPTAYACIEAAPEDLATKREIFRALDRAYNSEVLLASNTSSLSVTDLAAALSHPERVVAMHFFFPAPLMKLVEVAPGLATTAETMDRAVALAERLGRIPVRLNKDTPAFVVSRLLMAFYQEAIRLLTEGVASPEEIDRAVTLGLNHPMGPFALMDATGLDINQKVMQVLYAAYGEAHYHPPLELTRRVAAGQLGKKSGRGFFNYAE